MYRSLSLAVFLMATPLAAQLTTSSAVAHEDGIPDRGSDLPAMVATAASAPLTDPEKPFRTLPGDQPVRIVLKHRGELGLSDAQVVRLEEIAEELRNRNADKIKEIRATVAAHQDQIAAKRRVIGTQERVRRVEDARTTLIPLVQAVMRHNLEAVDAMRTVLDGEQGKKAEEVLSKQRKEQASALAGSSNESPAPSAEATPAAGNKH